MPSRTLTPEQREAHNARIRAKRAAWTPEQRKAERIRDAARKRERYAAMTPEQREAKNARERARRAARTPEQRERHNERQRQRRAAMTPEQRKAVNARPKTARRRDIKPILSRSDIKKCRQSWQTLGNRSFDLRWYWWLRGDTRDQHSDADRSRLTAGGYWAAGGKDLPTMNDPHYLTHFNRSLLRRALSMQQQPTSSMIAADRLQHYIDRLTETLPLLESLMQESER